MNHDLTMTKMIKVLMQKTLQSIVSKKREEYFDEIKFGNEVVSSEENVASHFNDYFVDGVNEIVDSIPKVTN